MASVREKIVTIAKSYSQEKEKPNNSGFVNPEFEKKMKGVGFAPGQSWCAYFTELVYKEAYAQYNLELWEKIKACFNPSAVTTMREFQKNFKWLVSKTPKAGDLVVWVRYKGGKETWQGHIGIVEKVEGESFYTYEGNSDDAGGREGIEVAHLKRSLNFKAPVNGLSLLGFITPLE